MIRFSLIIVACIAFLVSGCGEEPPDEDQTDSQAVESGELNLDTSLQRSADAIREIEAAIQEMEEVFTAAENGDIESQLFLAAWAVEAETYEEAAIWLGRAADQGSAEAQYALGYLYLHGRGVVQDNELAASWIQSAAEQGYAEAQFALAGLYFAGVGVAQDIIEAIRWFRLAAEQGNIDAQVAMGESYYFGDEFFDQDYEEALYWFLLAAEQGSAKAQFYLGDHYLNGYGVLQDHAEAVRWYSLAARQGMERAQVRLGLIHAQGEGVAVDYPLAYMWFNIAVANGYEDARDVRDSIASELSNEQLAEAQEIARRCLESNYQDCS